MIDYIIVGAGLAGFSFAETLILEGKSFIVISDASQNSSLVAAGIYNPVILKRFSLPADSALHLNYMRPFYKRIEERLNIKIDYNIPVYRRFISVEEQNDWFIAADKPLLTPFLLPKVHHPDYEYLPSPYGFGEVLHTGYIDTVAYLDAYANYLVREEKLIQEAFDYSALRVSEDHVSYKGITAKHIVFAEGFGIHANPFFNHLPLDGTKGELLVIKASKLKLDVIVNGGVFILPIGDDLYKVGATYEWYDKTSLPTEDGLNELVEKLNELITCDYEIISHLAGIRPTTKDRKSLIGTHPKHKNMHLLNGLGTRGVMLGPYMAKILFGSIEYGNPIERPVDLRRFKF
jgi:glycine/D-amino acid oxidase-like deaminating enzyme